MTKEFARNVKWIEGLRGLASFSVLLAHLARAFDYDLYSPRDREDSAVRVWQLPIIRILWQGRIGVCIFGLLIGYVCALKPLKLIRAGDLNGALSAVAKTAFRRTPRFVLPATFAMLIAWAACQCGAFTVAHRVDAGWIRDASPRRDHSFADAFEHLTMNFRWVWSTGRMDYDDHQWALLPLLKGSFMVYGCVCAVAYVKFGYRLVIYAFMYSYFYQDKQPDTETFGCQMFFGMFLYDFFSDTRVQEALTSYPKTRKAFSVTLIVTGLLLASFPSDHPEWSAWSKWMLKMSPHLFPKDVNLPKRFSALGIECISLGISLSPTAKAILSHKYLLWLGRQSFAVYLVHGTLLKTVLMWMVYGPSGQPWIPTKNDAGEEVAPPWLKRGGPLTFMFAIPVWLLLVYGAAYLWTAYVDAICARITMWLERLMFEQDEKSNGTLLS